jgi:four helix bundle suffix protein
LGRDPSAPSDLTDPTDAGDRVRWARYAPWLEHEEPEIIANALICLIHQANYLLDQQITALERGIIEDGGYREQLTAARIAQRERDRTDPTERPPDCPRCGKPMRRRTARQGKNAGSQFWGCAGYPECKGIRPVDKRSDPSDPSDPSDRTDPTDQGGAP